MAQQTLFERANKPTSKATAKRTNKTSKPTKRTASDTYKVAAYVRHYPGFGTKKGKKR